MNSVGGLLTVLSFAAPFFGLAQTPSSPTGSPGEGTTYGLVIGVANYTNHPKLGYADKDALEFYLYLLNATHSDEKKVTLFLNNGATREKIAEKFTRIVDNAQPGDRVFIYFSGHGDTEQSPSSDNFFLLLTQSPEKNYLTRPNEQLDKDFFDHYIQRLINKQVRIVFICDACHAGSLIGGETGKKTNAEAIMHSWKNEIKLLSCQPDQTSQEGTKWGGGRSLFSFYLLLGIEGLADKDGNGQVSVSELQDYLNNKVVQDAKQFEEQQQPAILGDQNFIISKTSPDELSAARQQLLANSASPQYNRLSTVKGAPVRIGNNTYIFKGDVAGATDQYLEIDPANAISDYYLRSVYYSFKDKIVEGSLLLPEDNSAWHYYQLFRNSKGATAECEEMRTTLLTALLQTYDALLAPLYQDDSAAFSTALRSYDMNNLTAAATLAAAPAEVDSLAPIAGQIRADSFFLQASRLMMADTSARDSLALPFIKQAMAMNSSCPAFYWQLGNFFFAKQSFAIAAGYYRTYVQLLPNEQHGHNRLGIVYVALGQNDLARVEFTKALQIDPSFPDARQNLQKYFP